MYVLGRVVCALAIAFWVVWAVVAWRDAVTIAIPAAITALVGHVQSVWRERRYGPLLFTRSRGSAFLGVLFFTLWFGGLMSGFLPTTPPKGGLNCYEAHQRMDWALVRKDDPSWLGSTGRRAVQQVRMLLRSYQHCFTDAELKAVAEEIEGRGIPW